MHPVISAVLIMAFSIAIVGMVISFGTPLLQSKKEALEIESGKTIVNRLIEVINDLSDDPISSSKQADIEFSAGDITFESGTITFSSSAGKYSKSFDGLSFNDIVINPGKYKLVMTKLSAHEILVSIE